MTTAGSNPQYCYKHPPLKPVYAVIAVNDRSVLAVPFTQKPGIVVGNASGGNKRFSTLPPGTTFPVAIGLAILLSAIGSLVSTFLGFCCRVSCAHWPELQLPRWYEL